MAATNFAAAITMFAARAAKMTLCEELCVKHLSENDGDILVCLHGARRPVEVDFPEKKLNPKSRNIKPVARGCPDLLVVRVFTRLRNL